MAKVDVCSGKKRLGGNLYCQGVTGARKLRVVQSSEGVASLFSANGYSGYLVISVSLQTNNDPF